MVNASEREEDREDELYKVVCELVETSIALRPVQTPKQFMAIVARVI